MRTDFLHVLKDFPDHGDGSQGTPVFAKGVIKKKYVEDGENIVECEIQLETHEGTVTTLGYAIVSLPTRE